MKNKDFNLLNLFSKTFKDRKMFSFIGYGELELMPKVSKPIRQTEVVQEDIIELRTVTRWIFKCPLLSFWFHSFRIKKRRYIHSVRRE